MLLSSSGERLSADQLAAHGLAAADRKPIPAARLRTTILRVLGSLPGANPTQRLSDEVPSGTHPAAAAPTAPFALERRLARAPAENQSVLVVEDNLVNQKVVAKFLEKLGFTAHLTNNGEEAFAALQRFPFKLVLMDVEMPVMDGFQATQLIREAQAAKAEGFTGEIRIVAMTANAMQGDRDLCLASGMDDYLTKPLRPDLLREVVTKYLGYVVRA